MPDSSAAPARTSYFWHPKGHPADLVSAPPVVVAARGEGVHIVDDNGVRLLDGNSGSWNINLGHSAEPIKKAIADQLAILPFYSSFRRSTNKPAEELARTLIEDWFGPEGMARAFFTSGGADSTETALRLARQYWKIEGALDRYKFISLKRSSHGSHFGGDAVSGRTASRRAYGPPLEGCFHIEAPYAYRNLFDEPDPDRFGEMCARLLEAEIEFQGPQTVAAFIAEPVMGAGGCIIPPPNYWPRIQEICEKYGVLLIADEVVTGFGRTGFECGCRIWNVKPDIICTAKPITGGYFPLGAVMVNGRIATAFETNADEIGIIGHGYTYSGHPVGCAAGVAALKMMRELRIWENARVRGQQLLDGLLKLKQKYALVGDVRAQGLMGAVEIVQDRKSRKPGDQATMARIIDGVIDAGVMLHSRNNNIILSPPLVIEASHVEQILGALDNGLSKE